jgi:hypothetical protein
LIRFICAYCEAWPELLARWKNPILMWIKNEIVAAGPRTSLPSPLLDGLEIVDDRAHLVGLEDEFRHVRVTGKNAFRQGLGKTFDFVLAGQRSEGWRVGVDARSSAADGMTAGTVGGQQRLAASCRRAGSLAQSWRRHPDHDEAEQKTAGDCVEHGPLSRSVDGRVANCVEQAIPQQRLLYDRHAGFFGLVAQRHAGLAGDQNRGRRKIAVAQLRDQVQPIDCGGLLIDNQTIATARFASGQEFRPAGELRRLRPSSSSQNLSEFRTAGSPPMTMTISPVFDNSF